LAGISRIKEPRIKMKELIKFESRINSIKGLIGEKLKLRVNLTINTHIGELRTTLQNMVK
jgi:hypothetical protein